MNAYFILRAFFFGSLLGLTGRAFYLQVAKDPRLVSLATRQFKSKVLVSARRGLLLDRRGEPLVANVELMSLAANPTRIKNPKTISRLLAKSLQMPPERLLARLKEKKEFIWIKRQLADSAMEKLKKYGVVSLDGELPQGLWLVRENTRRYPHGTLARALLGSVNIDNEGTEGVELAYNPRLEGKVAAFQSIKDALGRPTLYDPSQIQKATDGENIELTLDASLQFVVEEELDAALQSTRSKAGVVAVMDAVSGEILALAHGPKDSTRARFFTDGYEPGSTFKPLVLALALKQGHKISEKWYGEKGQLKISGKTISESEAHEKFEWITLEKMIEVSSNVVAAKLALKLGGLALQNFLKELGFGKKTGIKFPGELAGYLPAQKRSWTPLTVANLGFGQGILVTPVQMLRGYAALLNGGFLVTPTLVRETDALSPKAKPAKPLPERVWSQEVSKQVTQTLLNVVTNGTGKNAGVEGYDIAGKTGTAQTVDPVTKKYSASRYISTFIGFPVGVEPKVVILTLLDNPQGAYYAAETAEPLFKSVVTAVLNRYAVPPTRNILAKAEVIPPPKEDPIRLVQSHSVPIASESGILWNMPELKGLQAREVLRAFQASPVKIEVHGSGVVTAQAPEPNTPLKPGAKITIFLEDPVEKNR